MSCTLCCYATDGNLIVLRVDDTIEATGIGEEKRVERVHQSGITDMDIWSARGDENYHLLASGGDDTALCVTELRSVEGQWRSETLIRRQTAHSSAVVGVKFLSGDVLATVAKDQRLIVWKLDYLAKSVSEYYSSHM